MRTLKKTIASAMLTVAVPHILQYETSAAENTVSATQSINTPVPLGHPDFYPSHERPIGWRGDRTGAFPGATGSDMWDAVTPSTGAGQAGENIAWKVNTPGAGYSQPIVAGEKVFVTCDPNLLVCYSVHDGKELWRTAIDHTSAMDPETREKARAEIKYFGELTVKRGRWSSECEALGLLVQEAGGDMKAIWKQSPKHRTLIKPEATGEIAKLLEDVKIKALWERLYAEQEEFGLSYTNNDHGAIWTKEIWNRVKNANLLYDIWFDCRWEGYCTYSWPTPCSDGEFVYVTTCNNAVAAVSVADGSIKWLVWDHMGNAKGERPTAWDETGVGTRYANSPVLYRDFLVVNQDSHVRAYSKTTGKKIWELWNPYGARKAELAKRGPTVDAWAESRGDMDKLDWNQVCTERWKEGKGGFFNAGSRAVPEANSPGVAEVPLPDGSILPVVADGSLFLYRLEDGKVLRSDMPMAHNSSVVVAGNTLMKNCESTYIVRLTAKDRDTIETHFVHYIKGSGNKAVSGMENDPNKIWAGKDTTVYHDGYWYLVGAGGEKAAGNATVQMSVKDGSWQAFPMIRCAGGNPSFVMIGRRLYDFSGFDLNEGFNLRHDVKGVGSAEYIDLDSAKKTVVIPNALVDRRIAEDDAYAFRYAYMRPGNDGTSSSPYAQANRIFMRTKGILYCIGDPKTPFPVPKDCPPRGRVSK
jgi:outer membrane protein assembly factor BamB